MIMPGTPITDMSDAEMPSPSGIGTTEEGQRSSYILPFWDEKESKIDSGATSKDKFLLKVAIEASLAKLDLGKPLPKKGPCFTKGRKLLPSEMKTGKYVFDVQAILKKS
jgi:hypothetical protein